MKRLTITLALCALGLMAACSKQESAPAPQATAAVTPAPATAPAPAPEAENAAGKKVFGSTCAMCHSAGVAGAPKPGDKADWGPRIGQGVDTLYKHALEGFNGAKGQMPARGGNTALKDEEVKAAVDYMVALSR